MPSLGELQDELMAIVFATWPEITPPDVEPCHFLTSMQALDESFVERIKTDLTALPCVVLDIGSFSHDPLWGVRSRTYRARVAIYYIDRLGGDVAQPEIDSKLWRIERAIDDGDDAAPFQTFQSPPERGAVDSSPTCPVNRALAQHGKLDIVAGGVEWMPGLLVAGD